LLGTISKKIAVMTNMNPEASVAEKGLALVPEKEKITENLIQGGIPAQAIIPTADTAKIENISWSITDPETPNEHKSPNTEPPFLDEPPSERPVERVATTGEEYSVLTTTQKKLVILTASIASVFSPHGNRDILSVLITVTSGLHTN
jgi:hypothetical protein